MGNKTITIYFCDICKKEIEDNLLSKCEACNKDACCDCCGIIKYLVTAVKPGAVQEKTILNKEEKYCSQCYSETSLPQINIESNPNKQVNIQFSD